MQQENYYHYQTSDFLNDPQFIDFIKYQNDEDRLFWDGYEASSPENLDEYRAAKKELALIFTARRIRVSDEFKSELLSDIQNDIDRQQRKKRQTRRLYIFSGSAAAVLTLIVTAFWLLQASVTVDTRYGQRKEVKLPDGSIVTLNANSSIKYPLLWSLSSRRKVELDGEAYFKVVHLNKDPQQIVEKDRFSVFTKRLHIEVLGTEFNVKDRDETARITLTKGSVNVWSLQSGKHFILSPSQTATESSQEELKVTQTDPEQENSWLEGKIRLQETAVRSVVKEFEDIYGKEIVFTDTNMASVKIDGVISLDNEDNAIFVLSNILNVNVEKQGNRIIFKAKPQKSPQ